MARAKNTSRAAARKRTRETQRAELLAEEGDALEEEMSPKPAAPTERPRMFRMPNFREDILAVPGIFRTKRLVWLPAVLLLAGMGIILILQTLPSSIAGIADLYLQFFFIPPALFTFFVAGYVAPRASYLVGLLYGVFASVLWSIAILGPGQSLTAGGTTEGITTTAPADPLMVVANMVLIGALYGTLAGAFAAWYRDFLRGMRERGLQQRAEREAKERAKRRDERQEARRVAKQRPSS